MVSTHYRFKEQLPSTNQKFVVKSKIRIQRPENNPPFTHRIKSIFILKRAHNLFNRPHTRIHSEIEYTIIIQAEDDDANIYTIKKMKR